MFVVDEDGLEKQRFSVRDKPGPEVYDKGIRRREEKKRDKRKDGELSGYGSEKKR